MVDKNMIHSNLFGDKEKNAKIKFKGYDFISTETRTKVFFVFERNAYYFETVQAGWGNPVTNDFYQLRREICEHKGLCNINKECDHKEAIYKWLTSCSVVDFLQAIELYIDIRLSEDYIGLSDRLRNTVKDINTIFKKDKIGYEIVDRRINKTSLPGFETLVSETFETSDPNNIDFRIQSAISKYFYYDSSIEDKKDAIIKLAGVLEYLRDNGIKLPKKDDDDLFNIMNNFDIRHHKKIQQRDYDKDIWYDWLFYTFLASINVLLKLNDEIFDSGKDAK
jgi:hypothetical protein